jgi:hypothetical protein
MTTSPFGASTPDFGFAATTFGSTPLGTSPQVVTSTGFSFSGSGGAGGAPAGGLARPERPKDQQQPISNFFQEQRTSVRAKQPKVLPFPHWELFRRFSSPFFRSSNDHV